MTLEQDELMSAHPSGLRIATRDNWADLLRGTMPAEVPLPALTSDWPAPRPVRRSIVAVDIEGSTLRTNPEKGRLRQVMYTLVEHALHASDIDDQHREPLIDRGDGVLALIRPVDEVPITALLDTTIPTLSESVARHNERHPNCALRLRAVLHSGEVHHDGRGRFGAALDLAFRLLDAPELKLKLRRTPRTSLALVVSDDIYWSVVAHGYEGINQPEFECLVEVPTADRDRRGWVHIPRTEKSDRTG